jgi:hypothetical protein
MGWRPVAGRPLFFLFGLADIDMLENWFSLKCEPKQGSSLAPALTQAKE